MRALTLALIEKAANDAGFEIIEPAGDGGATVSAASALHDSNVHLSAAHQGFSISLVAVKPSVQVEWRREFPDSAATPSVHVKDEATLTVMLRRLALLSCALPDTPLRRFEKALDDLAVTGATERSAITRQRIGQQIFRDSLMQYWGGACAVTGVSIPEVLRASHIVPWAECESDAKRLDVFNGLLLSANFDALFDNHLVSFADDGTLVASPVVSPIDLHALGLSAEARLRSVNDALVDNLRLHRARVRR